MIDGSVFQQDWVWLGIGALAIIIFFWLIKNLIKWVLTLAIIAWLLWHFWLS